MTAAVAPFTRPVARPELLSLLGRTPVVRVTAGLDTHLEPGTNRENMADRRSKRRDANGSMFRWRGLSRDLFVDRSRLLRDEVRIYGWSREERIRALIAGADPDAPTLF